MTSTPVNVQGFVPGSMYGTNRVQGTESKGDFGKIFESQKNVADKADDSKITQKEDVVEDVNSPDEVDYKEEVTKTDGENTAENQAEATQKSTTVQEGEQTGKEQSSTQKDMEESELTVEELNGLIELFGSAVSDVKELLMQELQLTEEELKSLMQECNLSDMDLLELGNVKELVLQAADAGDMTALLTDEGLYSQIKGVEAEFATILQNVQETLEVNPEEVQSLAQQVDEAVNSLEGMDKETIPVEIINTTEETPDVKVSTSEQKGNAEQNMNQENNLFAQQGQMTQNVDNSQTSSVQMNSYLTAETENIMRQITEQMQIRLGGDATEVNMQLHPESLGTLQIKISAKEGIMTAQFTTASETVKSVLEGQMIQLQQQFDQQNIKVEAIEVTVQSHAFESALEKGNEQHSEGGEAKRNRTRKIDLNLLDGADEVENEDRILAQMMEANGNTVDYLV